MKLNFLLLTVLALSLPSCALVKKTFTENVGVFTEADVSRIIKSTVAAGFAETSKIRDEQLAAKQAEEAKKAAQPAAPVIEDAGK